MNRHNNKVKIIRPRSMPYIDDHSIFANKEIIFRSRGMSKVFNISPQVQIVFLSIVFFVALWSSYYYYAFSQSGEIISTRTQERDQTRDAYAELMSDFITIHKNIGAMINSLDQEKIKDKLDIDNYKQQAIIVEDKIKQITDEKDWISDESLSEKVSIREAFLQRDIAVSERDIMKKRVGELEKTIGELKEIEDELLDRVEEVAGKEIAKIKSSVSTVNSTLKKKGQYFNALSNKKSSGRGGAFVPEKDVLTQDKSLEEKLSKVYETYSDLEYYRDVLRKMPVGKPVWDYRVSSSFGHRSDPFNKRSATHKGIDLASRKGNKINVMADGKVVRSEVMGGYGNMIEIDHGNGFVTKYAHLNKSYVKKGDKVKKNQTIGEVGSTGRSTGPHLHYEVLYRNVNVDPMGFIKAGL